MEHGNAVIPTTVDSETLTRSQKVKNTFNALLNKKDGYSWAILLLVPISEAMALWAIRPYWSSRSCLPMCLWTLVLLSMTALWWLARRNHLRFSLKSKILTRLLANAVVPRPLGVCYLLSFAIHIGWIGNAVANLFVSSVCVPDAVMSVMSCAIGLLFIAVFFPDGRNSKTENPIKVFISGISEVKVPYDKDYKKLSLRPLVRVLQDVTDGNCELLILQSDFGNSANDTITTGINDVLRFISSSLTLSNDISVTEKLKTVIREVAIIEFPEKSGWIKTMPIQITKPCNYNDFSECFNNLKDSIKDLDDSNHKLAFNLTPGTGVIGSLMTLMAVDGDRDLYYYSQDTTLSDEERLVIVDKSSVPLKNLLSQALENIERDD